MLQILIVILLQRISDKKIFRNFFDFQLNEVKNCKYYIIVNINNNFIYTDYKNYSHISLFFVEKQLSNSIFDFYRIKVQIYENTIKFIKLGFNQLIK